MSDYRIVEHDLGIEVHGAIPISQFVKLVQSHRKYTITDPGISAAVGATCVLTTPWLAAKWRWRIDTANSGLPPLEAWRRGANTGTSSLTIYGVMTGENIEYPSTPSDSSDYCRCRRLLEIQPDWRARLGEVAARYPEWAPLVDHWDELEALYMTGATMTERIRELLAGK